VAQKSSIKHSSVKHSSKKQRSTECQAPAGITAATIGGTSVTSVHLAQHFKATMSYRVLSVVGGLVIAACLTLSAGVLLSPARAQPSGAAPAPAQAPAGQEPAKETQKADEYGEAQRAINGPAGNPECVWLGRRVVSLLWRDDLDTAFRHLDLYDRFGCPSGHIQAAFRCLVLHSGTIDPKTPDSLNGQVLACWINPNREVTPAAAASTPSASGPAPAGAPPANAR
jgi:hypothetical protein